MLMAVVGVMLSLVVAGGFSNSATAQQRVEVQTSAAGPSRRVAGFGANFSKLVHAAGVFTQPGRSPAARLVDYAIDAPVNAQGAGIPYLNTQIQQEIYRAYCQDRYHCSAPTGTRLNQLLSQARQTAEADQANPEVLGTYLTDDYLTNMSYVLPQVYAAIRAAGNNKPVACGVGVFMGPKGRQPYTGAALRLGNYSARWCNSVVLYILTVPAPGPRDIRNRSSVYDWGMASMMPVVLNRLRSRGFVQRRDLLIGSPQAFSFQPRTGTLDGAMKPQWWAGPTPAELTAQVVGFCRYGAKSIAPYAWNDHSTGVVTELYNSPRLRSALAVGLQICRRRYW